MHRCKKINQFHAAAAVISVAQIGARSLLEEHEQHETHDAAAAADMSQSTTRTCLMRWPCHTNHTNDTQQPQPPSLLLAPERRTRRSTRRYHRLMDMDSIAFYFIAFVSTHLGPAIQYNCNFFVSISLIARWLLISSLIRYFTENERGREGERKGERE